MSTNKVTKSIWDTSSEDVLKRGLNAMTKMCDVLTNQNETLNTDIQKLRKKVERLQDKLLHNGLEKE
jgi:polyhydroxyalkanoate synthesis regulator phasin